MTNEQQQLQRQVNEALDESIQSIDELTLAKIKAARLNALEQQYANRWWRNISLKQGVLATSFSLFAVAVLVQQILPEQQADELALLAMMNPVLSEEPEMLENLEFIAWLESESALLELANEEQGS